MMGLLINRENAIKGLENTAGYFRHLQSVGFFGDQPVYREHEQNCNNAIALLKEQESVIEALKSDLDETLAVLGEKPEIVRCADCKYCVKEPSGELYCDILAVGYEPLGSKKVNGDWYCADGERR